MATFIDINLDYQTSTSRPVRAESDISKNPGYNRGKNVSGNSPRKFKVHQGPSSRSVRVLKLLGALDCRCGCQ